MEYWHIQMYLPQGRNNIQIDSLPMLKEDVPVIGTGEWEDPQCANFKNDNEKGLKKGDIVLVREGSKPLAIIKIVDNNSFKDDTLQKKYLNVNFRKVKVLRFLNSNEAFPQPQGTLQRLSNKTTSSYKFIKKYLNIIQMEQDIKDKENLLKYKKQIIIQGAPGTGKTKLAKELANELANDSTSILRHYSTISDEEITSIFRDTKNVKSVKGDATYEIISIGEEGVTLRKETANKGVTDFDTIRKYLVSKRWESTITDNDTRRATALAKYIFDKNKTSHGEFIKLIQFHPSYTYEDFVRGIVAESNDKSQIEYKVVNKILTEMAMEALNHRFQNYVLIIDEINRANLSSVLGELIYALEYRYYFGRHNYQEAAVESMYPLKDKDTEENNQKIVLPENLYIIGTMNTADRSVGQIDYAIRRRFAFVDVVPKDISNEEGIKFDKELFEQVKALFTTDEYKTRSVYLSHEFDPKDVTLGHSYFIGDKKRMEIRLKYEIIPILREYVKDGVLVGENIMDKIEKLSTFDN